MKLEFYHIDNEIWLDLYFDSVQKPSMYHLQKKLLS